MEALDKAQKFSTRLKILLEDNEKLTKKLPVGNGHNYVVYSDLHIADKELQDKFKRNEATAIASLDHYNQEGFSLILLGDIEEFHRVDSARILSSYEKSFYKALRAFPPEKIHRVFGNHDIEWSMTDPIFPNSKSIGLEAIKLGDKVILTHGHQAEEFYESDVHIVRMAVTLVRLKENILGPENKYAYTQLPGEKDKIYADWAKKHKIILVCGHTHKPICASRPIYDWVDIIIQKLESEIKKAAGNKNKIKELKKRRLWFNNRKKFVERKKELGYKFTHLDPENSYYFNTGGGIYYDGITNIEIEGNIIRLVHWRNKDNQREQIWGDEDIDKILGF